jgi:hypothetical protein
VMALFRDLLADGGHVLFEFPNIDGWHLKVGRALRRAGLHRKAYPEGFRPGHCNEYCRESFRFLADRSGFDVLAWETYSSHPARDWLFRRWPVGSKVRTLVRKRGGGPMP